jgi:hypothetical protein
MDKPIYFKDLERVTKNNIMKIQIDICNINACLMS